MITEKRRQKRTPFDFPIIYTYYGEHEFSGNTGIIFDISDRGICFYTDKPLRKGLNIQVKIPLVWDEPKTCIVRWNSMKSPHCFRVGASVI